MAPSLTLDSRPPAPAADLARTPRSRHLPAVLTGAAALLVLGALVLPESVARPKPGEFLPAVFLRLPIEGLLGAALLIAAPARLRRWVSVPLGLGLGVLTVLKVVNLGFLAVLGRRFDPVLDWPLLGDGHNALTETHGRVVAGLAVGGAALLVLGLPTLLTLAVGRLGALAARFPRPARRTVTAASAAWVVFALLGTQFYPGTPVASDTTTRFAKRAVLKVPAAIQDRRQFDAEAAVDAFRDTPPDRLLQALRGKHVVVGVIESYGRSALEDPVMAKVTGPALAAEQRALTTAGFGARSGFLTSSTYGGGSWLAHASFQSGLWIDNQQRYRQLVSGDRLTLTRAFQRAGWRTVGVEPGNVHAWPEASFYGYDQVFDSRNLGYRGPRFGWSRMPDQYTLSAFQREVYAGATGPVFAELTLTSSHEPWTPVPKMVDWSAVGDGSGYAPMATGVKQSKLWKDQPKVRTEYARSVAYSVGSLLSWARTYGGDDLVLVMFGDHQAIPLISGRNASRDVPVTVIAKDPAVLARVGAWNFQDGLAPAPHAPVWGMDDFRDRFLTAFSD